MISNILWILKVLLIQIKIQIRILSQICRTSKMIGGNIFRLRSSLRPSKRFRRARIQMTKKLRRKVMGLTVAHLKITWNLRTCMVPFMLKRTNSMKILKRDKRLRIVITRILLISLRKFIVRSEMLQKTPW